MSLKYLLNSLLTKGSFALSQESELVDKFLGEYGTQTSFSSKCCWGQRGRALSKGRKEMVYAVFIVTHA